MTLTFNTHICSFFQLVSVHRLQKFWKINSFHFFLWKSLSYQILPCRKIGQGHSQGHQLNKLWWAGVPDAKQVSWKSARRFWRRRFLKGFYHIWAWRPSWSCDPDAANKLSFPLPKEAPHKIWLWLAKWFQRRRSLKLLTTDGRRTDAGPWVSYKLTYEPCPCNEHPLTPNFYIEKLGFTGVYIFFLFLLKT